jgi:hypothetical protein
MRERCVIAGDARGAHSGQNLAQSGVGANGERTADERRGGVRAGERRTGVDVPGSALDDGWKLPSIADENVCASRRCSLTLARDLLLANRAHCIRLRKLADGSTLLRL